MLLPMLLTAVVTALVTVAAMAAILPPLIRRRAGTWAAALDEAIGPRIEERVRAGVISAIESNDVSARLAEVETALEARVRKGIIDAISPTAAPTAIRESTRSVTEAGANIVEGGLQALLAGLTGTSGKPAEEPGEAEA